MFQDDAQRSSIHPPTKAARPGSPLEAWWALRFCRWSADLAVSLAVVSSEVASDCWCETLEKAEVSSLAERHVLWARELAGVVLALQLLVTWVWLWPEVA